MKAVMMYPYHQQSPDLFLYEEMQVNSNRDKRMYGVV